MRNVPVTIETECPELNDAWGRYSRIIVDKSEILISDTEEALNWHAFLGHSIDMQGFRAAEFAGVDELSKPAPDFKPLNKRSIGIAELGNLWEISEVKNHLLYKTRGTPLATTYDVLETYGGQNGKSLVEAFQTFPFRKGHRYVRALLQNSAKLKDYGYSFRAWLQKQCHNLGASSFPPSDFRQEVAISGESIEESLCKILEKTFFLVGPELAPYMICDWQMWLWKEHKTDVFDNFKLDSFHEKFVKCVNARNGNVIPEGKRDFAKWWHRLYPELPPRLANECIWLYVDDGLLNKTTG